MASRSPRLRSGLCFQQMHGMNASAAAEVHASWGQAGAIQKHVSVWLKSRISTLSSDSCSRLLGRPQASRGFEVTC